MVVGGIGSYGVVYACLFGMIWDYVISGVLLLVTALFVVMAFAVPVRNVSRWRKLEADRKAAGQRVFPIEEDAELDKYGIDRECCHDGMTK